MPTVLPRVLKSLALACTAAGTGAGAFALAVPAAAQDAPPTHSDVPAMTAPAAAPDPRPVLGLMGTIPIYWGESDGLESLLAGDGESHWARARLEQQWQLRPIDHLDGADLAQVRLLLLAQPRALSGAENVALDAWVRGGGRLLLFADPLMTGESRFSLGDRRRPQDVILLSPILRHWGLDLQFDENQPSGPDLREYAGMALPVRLPGRFTMPSAARAAGGECRLEAAQILAFCTIGHGQVVVLADAALLDLHDPQAQAAAALDGLALRAFGARGETSGTGRDAAENGAIPVVSTSSPAVDVSPTAVRPPSQERRSSD